MEPIFVSSFSTTFFFCLILIVKTSEACHGYKTTKSKIEILHVDDPEMAVKLSDDFRIDLDENCRLISTGCIEVPAFKEAKASYHFYKKGMFDEKNENLDVCEIADKYSGNPQAACYLIVLGDSEQCPFEEKRIICNQSCTFATKVTPAQAKFGEGNTDSHWRFCLDEKCTDIIWNATLAKE